MAVLAVLGVSAGCDSTDGDEPAGDWQTPHPCRPSDPGDALTITALDVAGDSLFVDVEHGGGCEDHDYGLCWQGEWAESYPV